MSKAKFVFFANGCSIRAPHHNTLTRVSLVGGKELKPSGSDQGKARSFGLSVGTVCLLLGCYFLWRGRLAVGWGIGVLGAVFLVLARTRPALLKIPSIFWWRLAYAIGWINSRIILSVIFFLVITPAGVVLRVCGWDPLRLKRAPDGSGWMPYPDWFRDTKHYERSY